MSIFLGTSPRQCQIITSLPRDLDCVCARMQDAEILVISKPPGLPVQVGSLYCCLLSPFRK